VTTSFTVASIGCDDPEGPSASSALSHSPAADLVSLHRSSRAYSANPGDDVEPVISRLSLPLPVSPSRHVPSYLYRGDPPAPRPQHNRQAAADSVQGDSCNSSSISSKPEPVSLHRSSFVPSVASRSSGSHYNTHHINNSHLKPPDGGGLSSHFPFNLGRCSEHEENKRSPGTSSFVIPPTIIDVEEGAEAGGTTATTGAACTAKDIHQALRQEASLSS
jgi:hypothetical protein